MSQRIVLASASPRRRTLLGELLIDGSAVVITPADIDEVAVAGSYPAEEAAVRVATAKLQAVSTAPREPGDFLLAADTVVLAPDGEVLGKPLDAMDAARMMRKISSDTIHVVTAVATAIGDSAESVTSDVVKTAVDLGPIGEDDIAAYLQTDIPWDKAGALELQGASAQFVTGVSGCWSNVIGLPLCVVARHLRAAGGANLLHSGAGEACRR